MTDDTHHDLPTADEHPDAGDPGHRIQPEDDGTHEGAGASAPSKKKVALIAFLVLAAGALIAFLALRLKPEPERQEQKTPAPLVQVLEVEVRPVQLDVPSQGTVEPRTESTLVAQVAGRITGVADGFAEGGFFRRGQTLVQIDPRDYQLAVADAEAALAQARVGLEREQAEAELARQEWEELGRGGEPSALLLRKPQLAQAQANVEAARAAVERARLNLSRTRVTAPFDGRVRRKQADIGQFVGAGTPLAEVYATSFAEIRLPVSRQDLAYLDVGVGWTADGGGDASPGAEQGPLVELTGELAGRTLTWNGRVVRTAAEIDPQSRMLGVFARVDDPLNLDNADRNGTAGAGQPLPMGLFVEASIAGRTLDAAVVLPRRALRGKARSADAEVMVVDDEGRLSFRPVEVVRTRGDEVVIGSGLTAGERVVVSRLDEAVEGMTVRTTRAGDSGGDSGDAGDRRALAPTGEGGT